MKLRERAIQLADSTIDDQIEAGSTMPDTPDVMAYAIILALAAISEQLETISEQLPGGSYYAEYK